jgi:hypothetical protein
MSSSLTQLFPSRRRKDVAEWVLTAFWWGGFGLESDRDGSVLDCMLGLSQEIHDEPAYEQHEGLFNAQLLGPLRCFMPDNGQTKLYGKSL